MEKEDDHTKTSAESTTCTVGPACVPLKQTKWWSACLPCTLVCVPAATSLLPGPRCWACRTEKAVPYPKSLGHLLASAHSSFSTHLLWVSLTARHSAVSDTQHLQHSESLWCPSQNPNPISWRWKRRTLTQAKRKPDTIGLQKCPWNGRTAPFSHLPCFLDSPVCFIHNQPPYSTKVNVLRGFYMIHEAPRSWDKDIYAFAESV